MLLLLLLCMHSSRLHFFPELVACDGTAILLLLKLLLLLACMHLYCVCEYLLSVFFVCFAAGGCGSDMFGGLFSCGSTSFYSPR